MIKMKSLHNKNIILLGQNTVTEKIRMMLSTPKQSKKLEQKDTHVETEENIEATGISVAVKDTIDQKEEEEERKDNGQNITETGDILSLEEILYKELEKFSTAGGVCWHLSKDKKRTLCMFFVRYQSSYLTKVKQSPL